jgi:hypothetical protein
VLDAATNPARRLRFGRPDRLHHLEHEAFFQPASLDAINRSALSLKVFERASARRFWAAARLFRRWGLSNVWVQAYLADSGKQRKVI